MNTFEIIVSRNCDHRLKVDATVRWADLGVMEANYGWEVFVGDAYLIKNSKRKRKVSLTPQLEKQAIDLILEQVEEAKEYEVVEKYLNNI